MMSLDVQGSLKILFSFFCNKYFFTQLRLRMRNKTLLIRRHLIHYWHLSNQTTFHKTTFFPQRRWRQKNWAWKICFLLLAFGSVKGSKIGEYIFVFVPKTAERRRRQTIFPCLTELPRENCWWNIVRHGNVDAENCSEKVFPARAFSSIVAVLSRAQDMKRFAPRESRENRRQTHPFTSARLLARCWFFFVSERVADATALLSLISLHWFLMKNDMRRHANGFFLPPYRSLHRMLESSEAGNFPWIYRFAEALKTQQLSGSPVDLENVDFFMLGY